MAGGQGTRLGHNGPKGTYDIGLDSHKSLFELLCDSLKEEGKKYGVTIPWFIMTSKENNQATIEFFEKQIKRLESELNISPYQFKYNDTSLKDLRLYFNKSKNAIGRAVNEMQKHNKFSYKYIKDGKVMISKDGVKWLAEKYFRKAYLKDLELYKLELQERKIKLDEFNRRKI